MEVVTKEIEIIQNSNGIAHELTIDPKDTGTVIKALVSGIYTNPLKTILVEYVQNALDSHRAAKTEAPVKVILPSRETPAYIVEDWGIGMSETDVLNLLAKVCASNKRNSVYAGGFGIGFYAASAYCDSFTFRIRQNGIESLWVAGFGSGSGALVKLQEKKTKKPNGVRIEIPIELGDIDKIHNIVNDGLYAWIAGIEVYNADGTQVNTRARFQKISEGIYNKPNTSNAEVHILVGGLPVCIWSIKDLLAYAEEKLKHGEISDWQLQDRVYCDCHQVIPIYLAVDDAEITTNRENCRLTPVLAIKILTEVSRRQAQYLNELSKQITISDSFFKLGSMLQGGNALGFTLKCILERKIKERFSEIFNNTKWHLSWVEHKKSIALESIYYIFTERHKKIIIRRKSNKKKIPHNQLSEEVHQGTYTYWATPQSYNLAKEVIRVAQALGIDVEIAYTPKNPAENPERKRILMKLPGSSVVPINNLHEIEKHGGKIFNLVIKEDFLDVKYARKYLEKTTIPLLNKNTYILFSKQPVPGIQQLSQYFSFIKDLDELIPHLAKIYWNKKLVFPDGTWDGTELPIWEGISEKQYINFIKQHFRQTELSVCVNHARELRNAYKKIKSYLNSKRAMEFGKITLEQLIRFYSFALRRDHIGLEEKSRMERLCHLSYKEPISCQLINVIVSQPNCDYKLLNYILNYFKSKPLNKDETPVTGNL